MKLQILDNNIFNVIKHRMPEVTNEQCNNNYKPSNIISKVNNIKYLVFNPIGRKATIWFTYYEDKLLCILNIIGTNNYYLVNNSFNKELVFNNCLIFGYVFMKNNKQIFSFDKILNYNNFFNNNSNNNNSNNNNSNNNNLTKHFERKLNHFNYILSKISNNNTSNNSDNNIIFSVPIILDSDRISKLFKEDNKYNINNIIQLYNIYSVSVYDKIKKYNNYNVNDLETLINNSSQYIENKFTNNDKNNNLTNADRCNKISNYNKININVKQNEQIVNEVYFNVKAGINQDEYFAIVSDDFYSNLLIDSYKLSVYMNGLFRNIKENKNLDCLEESDDEDEFNNASDNKFTDINKTLVFKCKYNKKFKKWVPIDCNNYTENTAISVIKNIEKYL